MFEPDENWNEATPQDIPRPTYWPAILALGLALIFWGFLTIYFIGLLGIAVFIIGLAGWISEIRYAFTPHNEDQNHHES